MIDQFFVVDDNTFVLNSNTDELSNRVRNILGDQVNIERTKPSVIHPINYYKIVGQNFGAVVHIYPEGWDVYTPLGSNRRMIRIEFFDGNHEIFYGPIVESLGIFDYTKAELDAMFGVHSRINPIFDSTRNPAAIFIDRVPYTPFKVNPMGRDTTFPAYGVFVRNPREMLMLRQALRTSKPLANLLNLPVRRIH